MRVLSDAADVVACLPPVTEVVDLMAHGLAALADGLRTCVRSRA